MSSASTRAQAHSADETSSDLVRFNELGLDGRLVRAVEELGFEHPTPIQAEAIPHLIEGRDIIGGARTGSGKTAAFGLPLLHRVREGGRHVRALVLAPTRELAIQVADALEGFAKHLPLQILTIYGGVGYQQQLRGLKQGSQIVVGTPGRVLDHLNSGALDLSGLEMLVLDEADEMLQMGFLDDIERVIAASPEDRQVALFSATMPAPIAKIAKQYLQDPARVQVESERLSSSHITQRWIKTSPRHKTSDMARILRAEPREAALVFARTRANVANLASDLSLLGFSVDALHGDLSQSAREMVLNRLRAKQVEIVVATDVAARGLDVDHITHVFNYDLPESSETYVHRIGRTARAGRTGRAISLVISRDHQKLKQLQRDLGQKIELMNVPNDAQIAQAQRDALATELDTAFDEELNAKQDAIVDQLLESLGGEGKRSIEQIAKAAIALLAKSRNVHGFSEDQLPQLQSPSTHQERDQEPQRGRQHNASPRQERDNQPMDFEQINEVELFFPVGRRDGLRPADFVGALCNFIGLPAQAIGRVTLGSNKTFVGLSRATAYAIIKEHMHIELRGRYYPLQLSFAVREDAEEQDRQERPAKRPHTKSDKPHHARSNNNNHSGGGAPHHHNRHNKKGRGNNQSRHHQR